MAVKKKTKKDEIKKGKKDNPFKEKVGNELTPRQLRFCELYALGDKELFGNGTLSYMEAYNQDNYKVAQAAASRLLSNVIIFEKINSLLEEGGFNDQNVEKQHLFLINQQADLRTKRGAIDSYYRVKGRFVDKQEITGLDGGPIEVKYKELTDDELKLAYEKRIKTK